MLAFVFASLLALLPLVVAAVSILATFLMLLPITYLTDVSFIVEFLIALIGLGVAIDYSLLLVTRWREERDHGRDNHEAVVVAMQTAGQAVLFSGVTVAIGLLALVVLPVPFMRSMGYGGALIPLASVLTTLTLTPAILGGIGPRVDWPKIRHENRASRVLEPLGGARRAAALDRGGRRARRAVRADRRVLRHQDRPGVLGLAGQERAGLRGAADAGEGRRHHRHADPDGGPGQHRPGDAPLPTRSRQGRRRRARLRLRPIRAATANGQTVLVVVPDVGDGQLADASASSSDVKAAVDGLPGVVGVAGVGAAQIDFLHAVYGNFPLMLALIAVLTYILLVRAFRSLLLPLKAVVLNLVSLGGDARR